MLLLSFSYLDNDEARLPAAQRSYRKDYRRRYPHVDGSTLEVVNNYDGKFCGGRGRVAHGSSNRQADRVTAPRRGEFPIPVWMRRYKQQSHLDETASKRGYPESLRRIKLLNDEITSSNTRLASTISLLRARARDVAHHRSRLLRILQNERTETLTWNYSEGDSNRSERSELLL